MKVLSFVKVHHSSMPLNFSNLTHSLSMSDTIDFTLNFVVSQAHVCYFTVPFEKVTRLFEAIK